jgi:hypothetical protein
MEGRPIRKNWSKTHQKKSKKKPKNQTHQSKTHKASISANPRPARPCCGSQWLARPRPVVGLQTHGLLLSLFFDLSLDFNFSFFFEFLIKCIRL